MSISKRRYATIAVLFSFFGAGLGQLYNGQIKKAFVFAVLMIAVPLGAVVFLIWSTPIGVIATIIVGLVFWFAVLVDACLSARRLGSIELRRYNKWYFYIAWLVVVSVFAEISGPIMPSYYEAFKIPSGSMQPALTIGDHIMVEKKYYERHSVKRGDIVIFTTPDQPDINIVKRVIALPGETIEVRGTQVLIDDVTFEDPYASWTEGGVFDFPPTGALPEGKVFLLGDNR